MQAKWRGVMYAAIIVKTGSQVHNNDVIELLF